MDRLDRVLALVRRHRPGLRLVDKHDVAWMRAAAVLARPFMPQFLDRVTTVIGDTVYLPGPADRIPRDELARILLHELVHQLDQAADGSRFYVAYAALPMPVGRTLRAHYERRAYAVDLMLAWESGGPRELDRVLEVLVGTFSGPAYAWMWAGRGAARTYLAPVAAEVRSGVLQRSTPYDEILAAWRGPGVVQPPSEEGAWRSRE